MKAKHHKAISQIAQCIQGLLIIPFFIITLSLGAIDNTNDNAEIWHIVYTVVGRLAYIILTAWLLEIARRYAMHMYRLTKAKEKSAQRTAIQSSAYENNSIRQ